jgi:hypothetical protein
LCIETGRCTYRNPIRPIKCAFSCKISPIFPNSSVFYNLLFSIYRIYDLSDLEVFLEGNEKGAFTFALKPVVSDPIYDKSKYENNNNN